MTKILAAATAHRGNADINGHDAPRLWFALLASCLVGSMVLIAAGLAFRARHDAPLPRTESDVAERVTSINKSDRLPLATQIIPAATAPPDVVQPVAAPTAPLAAATDDDIRQAEGERHRRRDICPKGRTYFTKDRHQYWRCVR
jgi:hypothetical protein